MSNFLQGFSRLLLNIQMLRVLAAQSGWLVEVGLSALLLFIVRLAHSWNRRVERPL